MSEDLKKQLPRFLAAGFSAVGTDFSIYYLLFDWLGYSPAKTISFLSGTIVAYLINKYWTFGKKEKSYREMAKFLGLYVFTLGANVSINLLALVFLIDDLPFRVFSAFLLATGISTILNFLGQKFWVFANKKDAILD